MKSLLKRGCWDKEQFVLIFIHILYFVSFEGFRNNFRLLMKDLDKLSFFYTSNVLWFATQNFRYESCQKIQLNWILFTTAFYPHWKIIKYFHWYLYLGPEKGPKKVDMGIRKDSHLRTRILLTNLVWFIFIWKYSELVSEIISSQIMKSTEKVQGVLSLKVSGGRRMKGSCGDRGGRRGWSEADKRKQ